MYNNNCLSCAKLINSKRLTLCRNLLKTKYWYLEHKLESPVSGWLVLTLNHHRQSLVELTLEEWNEFHILLPNIIQILKEICLAEKIYVTQFAEKAGHEHVHWHIIPITKNHPLQYRGPKIFTMLEDKTLILPMEEVSTLCEQLKIAVKKLSDNLIF
jgi:diadenosine tetraphosphate (Ap4A) HIT family hydrolase